MLLQSHEIMAEILLRLVAGELAYLGPELALKVNEEPANTVRDAHVLRGMLKKGE